MQPTRRGSLDDPKEPVASGGFATGNLVRESRALELMLRCIAPLGFNLFVTSRPIVFPQLGHFRDIIHSSNVQRQMADLERVS